MQEIRRGQERGYADHGWLRSYHTFSFADYSDPTHIEFGALRVLNEDRVLPGEGFATHRHRDLEIITYVLSGTLTHRDSMGHGSAILPGDVQRMSAGRGVSHSEFNASASEPLHFLQIWIKPNVLGIDPSYEESHFSVADKRGRLRLIASPDREGRSVLLHQDARVYSGLFDGGETATLSTAPQRRIYLHVARGAIDANGVVLKAGDALKATEVRAVVLKDGVDAEVLLFDLPI